MSRDDPGLSSREVLDAMLAAARHRARDGQRSFVDQGEGIALAHCHTATFGQRVDLPAWHEDERVIAAVDGDVHDLPAGKSSSSITNPHAEAVAARFQTGEDSFPAGLDGVFSLFLWDRRRKTLHLSCDPLGRKLLYLFIDPARRLVVFSTELKAVLAHPVVPRELDRSVLPLYHLAGYPPASFTLAKDVQKLQPAECRSFGPDEARSKRFWRPQLETGPEDFAYWRDRVRAELPHAVRRTVGAADSVGVYLSGGVDSSVTLAALRQSGVQSVRAFTLYFEGQKSGMYDLEWARQVAEATGTDHEIVPVDVQADIAPELMSDLLAQTDEPFESFLRVINEYFLGRAAKVAGFDSILTGATPGTSYSRIRQLLAEEPALGSRPLEDILDLAFLRGSTGDSVSAGGFAAGPEESERVHQAAQANREVVEGLDWMRAVQLDRRLRSASRLDSLFYQFIPPLLGLEERTPFLDTRLMTLILSAPPAFSGLGDKGMDQALLREAFKDSLKVDFASREKRHFPRPPQPAWLSRMLVTSLETLAEDGVISLDHLRRLERRFGQGRRRAVKEIWRWFALTCWYEFNIKQRDPFLQAA